MDYESKVNDSIHNQILANLELKPGDIVKVTHKVPNGNLGWQAEWIREMDQCVGQEVEVIDIISGYGVRLNTAIITTGYNYNFPAQSIEIVKRKPRYKEMKISKDYTAMVYSDKIEVGCQTITIEDFRKLQKLVDEMDK
jgi:hypothetical protein